MYNIVPKPELHIQPVLFR